jgi:hypothetical protein
MITLLANPDHPNRFGMISVLAMITSPQRIRCFQPTTLLVNSAY